MKDHHGNVLEKMILKQAGVMAVLDLKGSQMVVRRELQVPEGLKGRGRGRRGSAGEKTG
jgi:hypothetical protein